MNSKRPHLPNLLCWITMLMVLPAASSKAAVQYDGSLTYVDNIQRIDLDGVTSVDVSPDGRFLYAAAYQADAVTVYRRSITSGLLSHVQTIQDSTLLNSVASVRVSPDGNYAVATAFQSNSVVLFARNSATGKLTRLDSVLQNEGRVTQLSFPIEAKFSTDSRFVYVIANNSGAMTVFEVKSQGTLLYVEATTGLNSSLNGARGLDLSNDGNQIFTAAQTADALTVFDRSTGTGTVDAAQAIRDIDGIEMHLNGVFSVAISPDDRFVYTSSGRFGGENAVSAFRRKTNGSFEQAQAILNGEDGLTDFLGGNELVISPDGENLYVVGSISDVLVVFSRDTQSGLLSWQQKLKHNVDGVGPLDTASGVDISPDGQFVYVAAEVSDAISIFRRAAPPSAAKNWTGYGR